MIGVGRIGLRVGGRVGELEVMGVVEDIAEYGKFCSSQMTWRDSRTRPEDGS